MNVTTCTEFVVSEDHHDTEYIFAPGEHSGVMTVRHRLRGDHPGHPDEGIYLDTDMQAGLARFLAEGLDADDLAELVATLIDVRNQRSGLVAMTVAPAGHHEPIDTTKGR